MAASAQTLPGQLTTQSPLRVKASRAALVPSPRRRSCSVRAAATGPGPKPKGDLIQNVRQGCDDFLQRYDVLSCGFGALCCTSVFVAQGQSPADALWITAAATVTGLVANELFFDNST
ncbi:g6511 [Coccomyxa elongata]